METDIEYTDDWSVEVDDIDEITTDAEGKFLPAGIVITIILVIIFIIASVLNTLFLIIFFRKPSLRSISNRFIVSLTAVNLLASWVMLPLVVADILLPANVWASGTMSVSKEVFCLVLDGVAELVATASVFATLLIALDRLLAITDPLHYHMLVTTCRSWTLIVASWTSSALIGYFATIGETRGRGWVSCMNSSAAVTDSSIEVPASKGFHFWFVVTNWVISFFIPLLFLTWAYVRIYGAAQQNSERARRNSLSTPNLDSLDQGKSSLSRSSSIRSTSSQIVSTLRRRISNASLFLYREEARAAKISVVVIIFFFSCWLPYYSVDLLKVATEDDSFPSWVHKLVLIVALSHAAISPYVYMYRSRRIQREVKRIFGVPLSVRDEFNQRKLPYHKTSISLYLDRLGSMPPSNDGNFDMELAESTPTPSVRSTPSHTSRITAVINKLFRHKVLIPRPWRESIISSLSCSTTSSTSSATSNTPTVVSQVFVENEPVCCENDTLLQSIAVQDER